jgi:hypothetical protein
MINLKLKNEQFESIKNDSFDVQEVVQNNTYNVSAKSCDMVIGDDVMNDLEVFIPYDNKSYEQTIFSKLSSHCSTTGGACYMKDLLNNPIHDITILTERIKCLRMLELQSAGQIEENLSENERDFLWFFVHKEDTINELLNGVYFSAFLLDKMNKSESIMTCYNMYKIAVSPMLGILSPIIYFIIPYLIITLRFGSTIKLSFRTYLHLIYQGMMFSSSNLMSMMNSDSGILGKLQMVSYVLSFIFYFQGLFNTISLSTTTYSIVKFICNKVNNAYTYLRTCVTMIDTYWSETIERVYVEGTFDEINEDYMRSLRTYEPEQTFSLLSNFGKQLCIYKYFPKSEAIKIANKAYIIDALIAITKMKNEFKMTYPTFVKTSTPHFNAHEAWHLCVNKDTSVKNNINFKNAIITGPNAGGKSTLIKTVCVNILLSQTCGITASSTTTLSPFYVINTQINIPDCKGVESLFEAEMNRCLYTLRTVEMHSDKPCLIVMDEIFNSTNMVEGIAGAYSILDKLSTCSNVMTIITTHFLYLTKLKKHTSFECYCMNVIIDQDTDTIRYPYMLKPGISRQYVALDLLRKRGFDASIIEKALKIKQKFTY